MLWALGQPAAFAGLLAAFGMALVIRQLVIRLVDGSRVDSYQPYPETRGQWFEIRRDVDPFGVVAAAIGGVGWGRALLEPRRILTTLAGPVATVVASQGIFMLYRALDLPGLPLTLLTVADVLRGAPGTALQQFVLALAVGLLAFGVFALIPLPPLDGWALLTKLNERSRSTGFARARHWLQEQNIGVAILLACLLLPIINGMPPALYLLDLVTTPVLRAWA